jgi:hypothetical protein
MSLAELRIVILGSGIAGVCCAQELVRQHTSSARSCPTITLVTPAPSIKLPVRVHALSPHLTSFDVETLPLDEALSALPSRVRVVCDAVRTVDVAARTVHTSGGVSLPYDRLCVCTGARPAGDAVAEQVATELRPRILTVRDVDSVAALNTRLSASEHVTVIGNGGIAMELVHALRTSDRPPTVRWCVRDAHLGHAMLDAEASAFLLPSVFPDGDPVPSSLPVSFLPLTSAPTTTTTTTTTTAPTPAPTSGTPAFTTNSTTTTTTSSSFSSSSSSSTIGGALGPFWVSQLAGSVSPAGHRHIVHFYPAPAVSVASSAAAHTPAGPRLPLHVDYQTQLAALQEHATGRVHVTLTSGLSFLTDTVVLCLGVVPQLPQFLPPLACTADGALQVDCRLRTSAPDVYAVCVCADFISALAINPFTCLL